MEFVRLHARVAPVPLVPELRIHQADDAFLLWGASELAREGAPLPFWAFPWAGGTALARHILDNPALVAGRRVLDLATGSGLVAIAAARAGAVAVTANDVDPIALAAAELNAAVNAVAITPLLGDLLETVDHPLFASVDVMLAGDIAYERSMAERVFALLRGLACRGIEAYVGDPGRPYVATAGLEPVAIYDVPVSRALEDADVKSTTVWSVRA